MNAVHLGENADVHKCLPHTYAEITWEGQQA